MAELKIKIGEDHCMFEKGTSLQEMAREEFGEEYRKVLGARIDNRIYPLQYVPDKDMEVEFIDITNVDGYRIFTKTVSCVFIMACKELFPASNVRIEHSLGSTLYCDFSDERVFSFDDLKMITDKMKEIIEADYPIERSRIDAKMAYKLFENFGYDDKIRLFRSIGAEEIDFYNINGHVDTFHGYLAPSTGYVTKFELKYYYPGVLISFPNSKSKGELPPFRELKKLAKVFDETSAWADIMGMSDLGALNEQIMAGKSKEIIRISEAFHEKKIAYIADQICKDSDVHLILIAGPSSSGKTTFANRLMMQLRVNGKRPVAISVDDYFVNRVNTPKNEDGSFDYETIDAIDLKTLNEDLIALLEGRAVELPTYNFLTGEREYNGNVVQLEPGQSIICEGIHSLNPKMTSFIPNKNKYKIYISALTQLNIDSHNRIPTTDLRVIRRMVRDAKFRGNDARNTFEMWSGVRRGEEKYIFPFQEEADIMFDSALVYELAVLKKYAVPMLESIGREFEYYSEARKLLKFLSYVVDIEDEQPISVNSLLREFIGGA